MPQPAKVVCVTLDSADHRLIRQWIGEGFLPHIERLLNESVSCITRNPDIIYSGTLWPSFNTGLWPGRHDNYFYLQPESKSYGLRLFLPEHLSVECVWNTLVRQGRRVALIDVPKAVLARTPDALQISFWGEHEVRHPLTCWPPELEQEVLKIAGEDGVGACDLVRHRPDALLRLKTGLISRATRRADLALAILARGPWDFFALNFGEAHCAGHHLWATRDPSHPQYRPEYRELLGHDPLREVYQAIDRSLGRLVAALGPDTFLMVLATHGIGPRYDASAALDSILRRLEGIDVPSASVAMEAVRNLWHQLPGAIRGPLRRLADRFYDAPRERERATRKFYVLPTTDNCGGVRINLKGREPKGLIQPGPEYEALCDWLERELHLLVNVATGRPVVKRVLRGDVLFAGPSRDEFPDLMIEWDHSAPIPAVSGPRLGEIPVRAVNPRTGDHRPEGLVLVRSADLAPRALEGKMALVDLAPTLAARLGVEIPGIDGKPVAAFLPQHAHV